MHVSRVFQCWSWILHVRTTTLFWTQKFVVGSTNVSFGMEGSLMYFKRDQEPCISSLHVVCISFVDSLSWQGLVTASTSYTCLPWNRVLPWAIVPFVMLTVVAPL